MNYFKKLFTIVTIAATIVFLVACNIKNLVDLEVNLLEGELIVIEGEDLPTEKIEVIGIYSDGSRQGLNFDHENLRYEYNPNPQFDHLDSADNYRVQDVKFSYNNKHIVEVAITTLRATVSNISLVAYGETTYQYNEQFDPSEFQLFVNFVDSPSQIVNLDVSMLDLKSAYLTPDQLGDLETNIYYNGYKAASPLKLYITKGNQHIDETFIKLTTFTKNTIEVEPIENALYAFYPSDSVPQQIVFQSSNIHVMANTEVDYKVFIKLEETQFLLESDIVSKTFEFKPRIEPLNLLFINADSVIFEYHPDFDLVLVGEDGRLLDLDVEVIGNMYKAYNLLPNHAYQFAFVETGTTKVYEGNMYKNVIVTKAINHMINYTRNQSFVYNKTSQAFNYSISNEYKSLEGAFEVDITYYLEGEAVDPVDVGVYDVEIRNNFSKQVLTGKLTITPRSLMINVLDSDKVYDDLDPEFEVDLNNSLDPLESFDIVYDRVSGEDVGTYQVDASIQNPNYNITVVKGMMTIIPRVIDVTVNNQTQIYGNPTQNLTYDLSEEGYRHLIDLEVTKSSGVIVGSYDISAKTYNPNFELVVTQGIYTITERTIFVTLDDIEVNYEDDEANLTYTLSEELFRTELELILTREVGMDAGSYEIDAKTLNPNFEIQVEKANYIISPKDLTVYVNDQTKTYGNLDPTWNLNLNGAIDALGAFSVEYTRDAGEDVGAYDITAIVTNPNYNITVVDGILTVMPRSITATLDNQTSIYGNTLETLTYTLSEELYRTELDLAVVKAGGLNAGNYAITASTTNENFTLTVNNAVYTITPRTLTVLGQVDTYIYNGLIQTINIEIDNIVSGDDVSAYVLDTTKNAGTRNQSITLSGNDKANYILDQTTTSITVTPKTLEIHVEDKDKLYGNVDPTFTLNLNDSLDNLDTFEVNYTRDSGNTVNTYEVRATVTNPNYSITVIPGTLTINPRPIEVTVANKQITYEDTDAALTYTLNEEAYRTELGLVISRVSGNYVGTYIISVSTTNPNFDIGSPTGTYTIVAKDLTVYVNNQTKTYGNTDPTWTLNLNGAKDALGAFSVDYTRDAGEDVGTYDITAIVTNPNYNITVVDGILTVMPRNLTINIEGKTKIYGSSDPLFTVDLNNSLDDIDAFNIVYTRDAGEDVGTYEISAVITNYNYTITVIKANLEITKLNVEIEYTYPISPMIYGESYIIEATADLGFDDQIKLSNHQNINVGTYQVAISIIDSNNIEKTHNYHLLNTTPTYIIEQKTLEVVADLISVVYGTTNISKNQYTVLGLEYADTTSSVLTGEVSFDLYLGNAGTYTISQGTLVANENYNLVFTESLLEVTRRSITLAFDGDLDVTYGDTYNVTHEVSVGTILANHSVTLVGLTSNNAGVYTISTVIRDAGNVDVTSNYDITSSSFEYTIHKKELTVTFAYANRYVGQTNSQILYGLTVSGFVYSQTITVLDNRDGITIDTDADASSVSGLYDIWVDEGYTSSNYTFNYITGTLEISQISLLFEFPNVSFEYDKETKGIHQDGIIIRDPITNQILDAADYTSLITFEYLVSGVDTLPVNVGLYNVVLKFAGNDMYEAFTHTGNTLSITPRNLEIYVEDKDKLYGDVDPSFSMNLNDSLDVLNTFTVSYSRATGENVGTYAIHATVTNPNYNITVVYGTLTINPRPITVTIEDKTITYEDSNLPLTYTLSEEAYRTELGLVLSRESGNDVGTYDISATTTNPNFEITAPKGTYTIQEKDLTVYVNNQTKTYGNTDPVWTINLNGAKDALGLFEVEYSRDLGEDVQTYTITATVENPNYNITVVDGTLTINPRSITATLDNKSSVYGELDTLFTYTLSEETYRAELALLVQRVAGQNVGSYIISASTTNENFNLTVINGTYSITPRTLTVVGQVDTYIYNASIQTIDIEINNIISGDNVSAYVLDNNMNAGTRTLPITLSGEDKGNYVLNQSTTPITIDRRDLTVEVVDKEKYYGDFDPNYTLNLNDSLDTLNTFEVSYSRTTGNTANTYEVRATVTNPNYNITVVYGTLTINPRPITVTINDKTMTYEDEEGVLTYSLDEEAYRTELGLVLSRESGNDVGAYDITATTLNANFDIVVETATYTIVAKDLTVYVDNQTKTYGDIDPTWTLNLNGAKDNLSLFEVEYSRDLGEDVNTYGITATVTNPNYNITVVDGTLTINTRPITVTIEDKTITYEDSNPPLTYTLSEEAYRTELGLVLSRETGDDVGTYDISATTTNPNFSISAPKGTYTIQAKDLMIYVDNQTKTYGDIDPTWTINLNGAKDNLSLFEVDYNRVAGENVGSYGIAATVDNPNYNITVVDGTLTITKRSITLIFDGDNSIEYNGEAIDLSAAATNLRDGDSIILSGHNQVNAGTHIATANIYRNGVDVSNNYTIDNRTFNYVITKKTISVTLISSVYEYTGENIELAYQLSGLIAGDNVTVQSSSSIVNMGTHSVTLILEGSDKGNYILSNPSHTITVSKGTLDLKGNAEMIADMQVFEYNYLTNSTSISKEVLLSILGWDTSLVNHVTFTGIDLLDGASTFIVDITVTESASYKSFSGLFILKLQTVSLGTGENPIYYTIEDALMITTSGTLVVRYNTAFAESSVSNVVYGTTEFTVSNGVTLLLPYSNEFSAGTNDDTGSTGNGTAISRNNAYVTLVLKQNLILNSSGTITVNAKLTGGTPRAGYVTSNQYSIFNLEENSQIRVLSGGILNSNGFIIGDGKIDALTGAKVYERLYIMQFRGGSITSAIYGDVFPFDQYGFNNIETELTINKGAQLYARVLVYVSGFNKSELLLAGDSNALINLNSSDAKLVKTYDIMTGTTTFDLYGETTMSDVSVVLAVTATTNEKDFPISGNLNINIKQNAKFTLDMSIKLLPGTKVHVEVGAEAIITNKGSIMIYDADEYYPGSGQTYPLTASYNNFRVIPTDINYNLLTPAQFINDGYIKVFGKIAGMITSSGNNLGTEKGIVEMLNTSGGNQVAIQSFDHSTGSSIFTQAFYNNDTYQLKNKMGEVLNITGKYQVHGDGTLWTTDIEFYNMSDNGNITTVTQIYGDAYEYPEWYNAETMSLYEEQTLATNIEAYFTNNTVTTNIYSSVYVVQVNKHYVSFETNGGLNIEDMLVADGTVINPNIDYIPTMENATFRGWYLDSGLSVPYNSQPITTDITLYARWIAGDPIVTITASTSSPANEASVTITATVKSENGEPLSGVEVIFTKNLSNGTLSPESAITSSTGTATTTFKGPGANDYVITATEGLTGKSITITIKVKAPSSGSPFLYSVDALGNIYFEHEPISHSMLKVVESTTYGTLKHIEAVNGRYYIDVVEEGDSITMLNGALLTYYDYDNEDVIDFLLDGQGNPHTIKERISPLTFIDHEGNSYLEQVLYKDGFYATFNESAMQPLGYYYATFDRPNSNHAKFMITTRDNSGTMDAMNQILMSINADKNLWWLDRAFMSDPITSSLIQNIFDSLLINVDVFDGVEWVNKGHIQRGSYLLEEFLLEIDLTGITTEQLMIRLSLPGQAGYIIDSVAVDYSTNVAITSGTMMLETALLNDHLDVYNTVANSYDDQYVSLDYKDTVRFGFSAPTLEQGYTRSIGVQMSGYIYAKGIQITDPLENEMIGKSFDEIKQIILDSGRNELIEDIEMIEEFYYSILFLGSMEQEIILDYLFNQLE